MSDLVVSSRGMRSQSFLKRHPGLARYLDAIRNDPCVWCMGTAGTVEHVVPRSHYSRGTSTVHGSSANHWSNVAMSCRRHNSQRGSEGLLVYLVQLHNVACASGGTKTTARACARREQE